MTVYVRVHVVYCGCAWQVVLNIMDGYPDIKKCVREFCFEYPKDFFEINNASVAYMYIYICIYIVLVA